MSRRILDEVVARMIIDEVQNVHRRIDGQWVDICVAAGWLDGCQADS